MAPAKKTATSAFSSISKMSADGPRRTLDHGCQRRFGFHSAKLQLSIATCKRSWCARRRRIFHWIYENWRGAYDLAALAQSVDLICLMTMTAHALDGTGSRCRMGVDHRQPRLRSQVRAPGEALAGHPLYAIIGRRHACKAPAQPDPPRQANPALSTSHRRTRWILQGLMEAAWNGIRSTFFVVFFYRDDLREWIFSPTRTPFASAIRW